MITFEFFSPLKYDKFSGNFIQEAYDKHEKEIFTILLKKRAATQWKKHVKFN
uniref:Uncharacterized protein n=1 Tax=Arion vulgaris TaxID=1028688 RepID=A0A0B6ZFV1_9EUPU